MRNSGRGIAYLVCVAVLSLSFCGVSIAQERVSSPKFSRDWKSVVEKMPAMSKDEMVELAKREGLLVSRQQNAYGRETIRFADPVTHETVLFVSIITDRIPRPQTK
jgi:hypothetical protein